MERIEKTLGNFRNIRTYLDKVTYYFTHFSDDYLRTCHNKIEGWIVRILPK